MDVSTPTGNSRFECVNFLRRKLAGYGNRQKEEMEVGGGSTSAITGGAGLRRVVLILTKQLAPSQSGDCGNLILRLHHLVINSLKCLPAPSPNLLLALSLKVKWTSES